MKTKYTEKEPASFHALEGVSLGHGYALAYALFHNPERSFSTALLTEINTLAPISSTQIEYQHQRLEDGLKHMVACIDSIIEANRGLKQEHILETYRLFAKDVGWHRKIKMAIDEGHIAEIAVKNVMLRTRQKMQGLEFWKQRLADLEDLTNRLLYSLNALEENANADTEESRFIVIAPSMGPLELLEYDRARLKGLILSEAAETAHVAIVARSMGIPVLCSVNRIFEEVQKGDILFLDGEHGKVYINPSRKTIRYFAPLLLKGLRSHVNNKAFDETYTNEGIKISLLANAGSRKDLDPFKNSHAEGVGLYRTEIPFLTRMKLPTVDEQVEIYSAALERVGNKPLTFRTLDIGGDKILPYLLSSPDHNPAMGWRAIRVSLDRPKLLRKQVRALIRASKGKDLRIMLPMVAEIGEFYQAKDIIHNELKREIEAGTASLKDLYLGIMLEIPSIIYQLPHILKEVSFISVGSNDLLQFFFASDRNHSDLAYRYDPLLPSFLSMLREITRLCDDFEVPLSICGEIASKPLEVLGLLGVGFRSLSMAIPDIPLIQEIVASTNLKNLRDFVDYQIDHSIHSLRHTLKAYAHDHGIKIQ